MKKILFLLFTCVAATLLAAQTETVPNLKVENLPQNGLATLFVSCEIKDSELLLNLQNAGKTPVTLNGLTPGQYNLVIKARGYYDMSLNISLMADTLTSISTSLKQITGFLDLRVKPENAKILIDGQAYSQGFLELPIGQRTINIKAFGYKEENFKIIIYKNFVMDKKIDLQTAPFDARGFYASTKRMNPRNSGLKGQLSISFSVTAPGGGNFTVKTASGEILKNINLNEFNDWDQSLSWDGRNADGTPLADGKYMYSLEVWPAAEQSSIKNNYTFDGYVDLDSSLVLVPTGAYSAMFGSEYSPEAFAPIDTEIRLDLLAFATGSFYSSDEQRGGLRIGLALALPPFLDIGAGLETIDYKSSALLGLKLSLPPKGLFGLAGLLEGKISELSVLDPPFVRLGPVFGFGLPVAKLALSPHFGVYREENIVLRTGIGSAISIGNYEYGASLSAQMMSSNLLDGFKMDLPLKTALELRFMPQKFIMSFRLVLGLDWNPGPANWMAGLAVSSSF